MASAYVGRRQRQREGCCPCHAGAAAVRLVPASWADDNHTIYADMGQQGYPQGAIPEWPWAALTAPLSQTAM